MAFCGPIAAAGIDQAVVPSLAFSAAMSLMPGEAEAPDDAAPAALPPAAGGEPEPLHAASPALPSPRPTANARATSGRALRSTERRSGTPGDRWVTDTACVLLSFEGARIGP